LTRSTARSAATSLRPDGEGWLRHRRARRPKIELGESIDTLPFEAYQVTCGITVTFGGLRIDTAARVIDTEGEPIAGLFAAGELVGGIFYFNHHGGPGLMLGAVFGRILVVQWQWPSEPRLWAGAQR
jgi:succinate dehydrogenase/fumarate reductase flavoprotein subunit